MVIFSGISISIAFQFLIVLLGLVWFPWITRGAAISGIIIGIIIVILTETIGQQISGNRLPWGRWPLTIHSGVWGLIFNVFICFSVSAFSVLAKIDTDREHRQKFHDFLNDHMGLHPSRTKLRSFAYVIALIWLFFGAGPGQVLGNNFFGDPGGGYEAWILKIPSIWGYQLIWWFFGIGWVGDGPSWSVTHVSPTPETVPIELVQEIPNDISELPTGGWEIVVEPDARATADSAVVCSGADPRRLETVNTCLFSAATDYQVHRVMRVGGERYRPLGIPDNAVTQYFIPSRGRPHYAAVQLQPYRPSPEIDPNSLGADG